MTIGTKELAPSELDTFDDESLVVHGCELGGHEPLGTDRHYASASSRLMMRALSGSL